MAKEIGFSLLWAIVGGVIGFIIGTLLDSTAIFPIANIPYIGLFLGVLIGAFKDKIELL